MSKFIFITSEGYTYQPNSTSPEPDIDNMQVIGFGEGPSATAAFMAFIHENPYIAETSFNEIIAVEIKNNKRTLCYLKNPN